MKNGFILPGQLTLYAAGAAAIVIFALSAGLWFTVNRLDACRTDKAALLHKYNVFTAEYKALSEAAAANTKRQTQSDQLNKKATDEQLQKDIIALRAANERLRTDRARTRSRIVPPAAASSGNPDAACFGRAELDRGMEQSLRDFEERATRLIEQGDEARVGLDAAKRWAQKP